MTTAAHTKLVSTVSGLSDSQLLEQTSKLARLDHQIQVFVIDHLLEIESRTLYLSRGFSSLFDYVAHGLGYSDAAAWRRINAMKLCAHVEGARERLRDGSLTLDAAAQLQAAFERRDRERALGGGRWEIKAVIDEDCQRGLEQLKGLLSHVDPHMSLGQLVGRLVREGLDRHDPGRPRRGRSTGSRPAGAERTSAPKEEAKSNGATTAAAKPCAMRGYATNSTVKAHAAPVHGGTPAARGRGTPTGSADSALKRSTQPTGSTSSSTKSQPETEPLRRSTHRAPLRVTASAADRSRVPLGPGRRREARRT